MPAVAPVAARSAAAIRAAAPRPVGGTTDYSYVGRDLVRIAVIAVTLFALMGVLKLVIS